MPILNYRAEDTNLAFLLYRAICKNSPQSCTTLTKWSPAAAGHRRVPPPRHRRDPEMPKPAGPADPEPVAEELLREHHLHPPVHVVQEHVGVPLAAARARQGRRRPYRRHPPRRRREVPLGCVHHDHVPLRLVQLRR
uniref:Uncharacterized protein n=1 Tax=Arundo donax TaxID=35708 RepID=A0A0A9DPF5_ARUDO